MFEGMVGADLAVALAAVDPRLLPADEALAYALAAARLAGWAVVQEAAGLARTADDYPEVELAGARGAHRLDRDRLVATEVRAAYGCSQVAAYGRLATAEAFEQLPEAALALREGTLGLEHVRVLVRETERLRHRPDLRRQVVERLLAAQSRALGEGDSGLTVRQVGVRVRRAVLEVDPTEAEQEAADARADRGVWHESGSRSGAGVFGLSGPVEATAQCREAVDALARQWRRQGRAGTLDQLRFDAAHHLLTTRPVGERVPAGTVLGRVTIPLSSLLGWDDAPGELAGVGAVPASVARSLMARAAVWQRLLTDPVDGHVVLQEVRSYVPTAAMRRFVLARHGEVCSARGCGARHGLQLDHVAAAPSGPTSAANLAPVCPADHNAKTHGGWEHDLDPATGELRQTSPLGRTHRTVATPPVGPTGTRAGPVSGRRAVAADAAEAQRRDRLSGQVYGPPADGPPLEEQALPPLRVDPAADSDRWAQLEQRLLAARREERRERAGILRARHAAARRQQEAAAEAQRAEEELLAEVEQALLAATDHELVAALDAADLAELNACGPFALDGVA